MFSLRMDCRRTCGCRLRHPDSNWCSTQSTSPDAGRKNESQCVFVWASLTHTCTVCTVLYTVSSRLETQVRVGFTDQWAPPVTTDPDFARLFVSDGDTHTVSTTDTSQDSTLIESKFQIQYWSAHLPVIRANYVRRRKEKYDRISALAIVVLQD